MRAFRLPIILGVCLSGLLPIDADEAQPKPETSFRFRNVTEELGLTRHFFAAFTHAMAWGDFDGDGRPDLFLGTFAERGSAKLYGLDKAPVHMLFRQTAAGKFERLSEPAVELPARCSGAVFADLDNDGTLELYVSSNRWETPSPDNEPRKEAREQGCRLYRRVNGKFVDISRESGACPEVFRCRDIGVFDYDGDGLLDLLVLQNTAVKKDGKVFGSRLFRNLGKLRFEDVTTRVGLPEDLTGLGITVADLNGDRRPDFFVAGSNRLYLSQAGGKYKEAVSLREVFDHKGVELDPVTGAFFGDLNLDGKMDLVVGTHHYHGPSRVHVFLNEGLRDGVPRFREITRDLGIPAFPQKAPHAEIQDFDNDGIPDLYWSVFFAEGKKRWPFICKGLGVKNGLPRFLVPEVTPFDKAVLGSNVPAEGKRCMVYYVASPVLDIDGDGRLDLSCGNWPPAMSNMYRNETPAGNWLQVSVRGKTMNRMGVGAQVRIFPAGSAAKKESRRLLGYQEISLNGGYSTSRPAIVHFGLGKAEACDVEVTFPTRTQAYLKENVQGNRRVLIEEPE